MPTFQDSEQLQILQNPITTRGRLMGPFNFVRSSYGNQWGDFCESTLDPDGLTFWHTNQYIRASTPYTRIFSYRLSNTTTGVPKASAKAGIDFEVFQNGGRLNVHVSGLTSDEPV